MAGEKTARGWSQNSSTCARLSPYALLTFYHTRRILSIGFASFFGRPFRRPFLSCLSVRCTRTQLQGVYDPTKGKICCMASQQKFPFCIIVIRATSLCLHYFRVSREKALCQGLPANHSKIYNVFPAFCKLLQCRSLRSLGRKRLASPFRPHLRAVGSAASCRFGAFIVLASPHSLLIIARCQGFRICP